MLSPHFQSRKPSAVRLANIEFMKRKDGVKAVNAAIGNVTLPMHPAMQKRMRSLGAQESPFKDGVVAYTPSVGTKEANDAVLNILASSGIRTQGLFSQITDGGSQAMEIAIVGACGPAGSEERPLMLIDAAYVNYVSFAQRLGRKTVSIERTLHENGKYSLPDMQHIDRVMQEKKPGALVVIPYDNPTGHLYDHETMVALARLCVKHSCWMVSDEAYRELHYVDAPTTSVWKISEEEAPGITGKRMSIETSSKVWNACGLRIGALVTDNKELHEKAVAEYTANLCANAIGQWIFGALAHESHAQLREWYDAQRAYYKRMIEETASELKQRVPGIIVSSPDAALYSVVDVKNVVKKGFDCEEFVTYCASKGKVEINGTPYTLLTAPMKEFYHARGPESPGMTQLRIAFVETPERMKLVAPLFAALLKKYEDSRD